MVGVKMKEKYFLFFLIVGFADLIFAQSIHKITVGSIDNRITIKVTNATNEIMKNVQVNLVSSPDWIKFSNDAMLIESLEGKESENVSFTFLANNTADIGEESTIMFTIHSDNHQSWQKTFKVEAALPDKFELFQNYPNPFNPSTTIKFTLPQDSFVSLKIFNIVGEEVRILVNEEKKAGIYNLEFNASQLASGTYFYTMQASNYKAVNKMILLK